MNSINKSTSLKIDKEGNCYVLGTTWMADSTKDILLVKFDPQGNEVWVRTYDNPAHGDDIPMSMCFDPEGNIWVCGMARIKSDNADFLIVKFTPDGIPIVESIDGGTYQPSNAEALKTLKEGSIVTIRKVEDIILGVQIGVAKANREDR